MKIQFEQEDMQHITEAVIDRLKPLLTRNASPPAEQILDTDTLATYLAVDVSWIYKQVQKKTIPYYKMGKYIRFKKSAIDRWLEGLRVDPTGLGGAARLRVTA